MQLINPIWLWGLTGLLVPLGIHLLSRKEGKVIKFGSLRHLEESHTKQSINVRLNEVVLLIIRCALIFLIVVLLCGLRINQLSSEKSNWIILEKGLEKDPGIVSLIDSLKQNGFQVRSMTKGFPNIKANDGELFANYWEMVDKLPLESLDKAIIVAYNYSSKFRGKRIALPENVTWISKEPEQREFTLSRVRFSRDSVLVRAGKSTSLQTSFTNLKELNTSSGDAEGPLFSPDTVNIEIHAEGEFDYDQKTITASLHAIERTIPVVFKIATSASGQQNLQRDWIIWLSRNNPDAATTTANILVLREDKSGKAPLLTNVTRGGGKQEWLITKRLNEETALEEQLTLNLTSLLFSNDIAQSRADSLDQTTRPEGSLWSQHSQNRSTGFDQINGDKAEPYLLFAIIVLLLSERFMAFKRNA